MRSVSVCLLTYNRAQWLPQTIKSIQAQSFCDYELIISDNASTDHTREVCEQLAASDPRIRYYRNATNLGLTGNYQAAIERAKGDYVAYLHDNDLFHVDLLTKWIEALDRNPNVALVFNAIEFMDFKDQPVSVWSLPYPPLISPARALLEEMLTGSGSPIFGMVMVVRSRVMDAGLFDREQFPNIGDVDMWMRLLAKYDAAYIAEPLIRARIREKNHFADKWSTTDEWHRIQRLHIKAYCSANPQLQRKIVRQLDRKTNYYGCRKLFGWFRRGRFDLLRDAVPYLLKAHTRTLRFAGWSINVLFVRLFPSSAKGRS